MIDFPLNISNVLHNLNTDQVVKIITENMLRLAVRKNEVTNFQELAYETYGKTLSDMFLINYTEKLWGQPADKLDSIISKESIFLSQNILFLLIAFFTLWGTIYPVFSESVSGSMIWEYRESDSMHTGKRVDRDFGFDVNLAIRG